MTKRRTPRKKRKQNKSPSSKFKLINLVLMMTVLTFTVTIASYFIIFDNFNKKTTSKTQNEKKLTDYRDERLNKYFDEIYNKPQDEEHIKKELSPINTIPSIKDEDAFEEYTQEFEKEYIDLQKIKQKELEKIKSKKEQTVDNKSIIDNRPKLSIVIDDVTLQSQVNKIRNIGYTITMSFMPPTRQHPNSAKIAKNLPFYIVHFPLQAKSFKFEEENTLHVGDSYEKIETRVKKVREYYPEAVYTNNHTGSKFTSDDTSMDYLIKALKKYDFQFIDSRTTAHSVVKKYTKKYEMPYIARNIFLDNKKEFNYIQNQLRKSIRIAKKTGSAIAIGHPYPITIKVLKESKHLLKDLNLVYVNKIPVH